ncbi:basement membrane-specific heparan sulfate proteoglycan core protein-like [Agrilus planipennis]|uniref:Basement membrane-specific heparan sulfate proteoglycan core protein-like n=1 Tax=Agrilus planipennis TaxID=224129 RepID=A0A7F5RJ16_AGRPL|nr:basement membrane-specific heparan sulfate proteoglycan core protein-like [Agrilus planipennis]
MKPRITPGSYYGKSGDKFTLTCQSREAYRSIDWTRKDGHLLPYSSSVENAVLTVYDAKPEDSGVYVCTVTSYSGTRGNESAVVSIATGTQGEYPEVRIEPQRQTISQGSTAEIVCNVSGFPPPTIKWTKVGDALPPNAQQIGSVLRINNVQISDRGVYVCVASNDVGIAQASSIIEIDRREAPVVEIYPSKTQTVTIGSSAILQCRVTAGIPQPTVVWSRSNGLPLGSTVEQLSNGVLKFNAIVNEDNGEYICTAENAAGKVTAVANIEVQTVPVVTLRPSGTVTVRENDYVRLECQAEGFPLPTVQWSKYVRTEATLRYVFSNFNIILFHISLKVYAGEFLLSL